jgi:hypothetical protein
MIYRYSACARVFRFPRKGPIHGPNHKNVVVASAKVPFPKSESSQADDTKKRVDNSESDDPRFALSTKSSPFLRTS